MEQALVNDVFHPFILILGFWEFLSSTSPPFQFSISPTFSFPFYFMSDYVLSSKYPGLL